MSSAVRERAALAAAILSSPMRTSIRFSMSCRSLMTRHSKILPRNFYPLRNLEEGGMLNRHVQERVGIEYFIGLRD
jgi:hypothetical protein